MSKECECAHNMALAAMALNQAWEATAKIATTGSPPEWMERSGDSPGHLLAEYERYTREMMAGCGLRLGHVYPFRPDFGDAGDREKIAMKNWENHLNRIKALIEQKGFDETTFDMLNEALVVGTECFPSEEKGR